MGACWHVSAMHVMRAVSWVAEARVAILTLERERRTRITPCIGDTLCR